MSPTITGQPMSFLRARISVLRRIIRSALVRFNPPVAALTALIALSLASARADSVVVFNEIMFHPATNEPAMEWIELHNQNSVDVDLGGWKIAGGIDYTFPIGTVIRGGGQLVVAVSPATLMAATGATNIVGPFTGRLSNNGEELRLRDLNSRLMDSVSYGVDGEWPEGADGSGMSLVKRHPNLASGPAENWTVGAQFGGTPGVGNFTSTVLTGARNDAIELAGNWRFHDGGADLGTAWRNPVTQHPAGNRADNQTGRSVRIAAVIAPVLAAINPLAVRQPALMAARTFLVIASGIVPAIAGVRMVVVILAPLPRIGVVAVAVGAAGYQQRGGQCHRKATHKTSYPTSRHGAPG